MAASRIKGFGVTGFSATSTSVAATTTAGTANDIHVAQLIVFNQAAVITPPSGWVQIGGAHNISTEAQITYWWWKDDGSSTSFTWSWTGSAVDRAVWVETHRGIDQNAPVQTSRNTLNQGTSATATNPGVNAVGAGATLLYITNNSGFTADDTPAGYTLRNNTIDQGIFSIVPQAAGNVGAVSQAISASSDWLCDLILLRVPERPLHPQHTNMRRSRPTGARFP